jgi:hypothetical protein
LEADPTTSNQGAVATAANAFIESPGVTLAEGAIGALHGGPMLSHDDAVKQLGPGYDASVLPKTGINAGALDVIRDRQDSIQANESIAARADTSTPKRFIASLVGGLPDPVNAAVTALAPEARGATLATRLISGAAEGGAFMAGADIAEHEVHSYVGDPDVRVGDVFRDVALGATVGAVSHGLAGPRNAGEVNLSHNNPGNLKVPGQNTFQSFGSIEEGIAAVDKQLDLYRKRDGLNTISEIVNKYAPPGVDKNNTAAYIADVEKRSGIGRDAQLTEADVPKVRDAMIIHEQGPGWREKAATFGKAPVPLDPTKLQVALAQVGNDAPVKIDTPTLEEAIPQPNSALQTPPTPEPEKLPEGTEEAGPLFTQAQKHLSDAMDEAKNLSSSLEEEGVPEFKERDEEIAETNRFTDALQAALNCGARRGFD